MRPLADPAGAVKTNTEYRPPVSIFHLSLKSVGRSSGRSSTAAAAYRAAARIVDERTGVIHDYEKKGGVESARVLMPGGGTFARAELWNAVELHHKRGDATPARECVVALPAELPTAARRELAEQLGQLIADTYTVAVDVCVHAPSKKGDDRNHHAHILMTACSARLSPAGELELGKKVETLDPIHCQRRKLDNLAEVLRPAWEVMVNEALARAGSAERIDHRSHAARGITELPGSHLGPAVMDIKRRAEAVGEAPADVSHVLGRIVAEGIDHAERAASLDAEMAGLQDALQDALRAQEQAQAEVLAAQAAQVVSARAARLEPRDPAPVPAGVRLAEIERDLDSLRAEMATSAPRRAAASVPPKRAEVRAAKAELPALRQRFQAAVRQVKELGEERAALPWWRLIRAWQLSKQLPAAEAQRSMLAARGQHVEVLARVPDEATLEARLELDVQHARQVKMLEAEAKPLRVQVRREALEAEALRVRERLLAEPEQTQEERPRERGG